MDVEKLIGLVQSKPPLWNQAHPDHQNRFVVAKLWDGIATEMDTDHLTTIYIENPKPGKHPKLVVDNNSFIRHRTQTTKHGITIRWRCTNVFRTKCKAVLYTTLQEGSTIKMLYGHNHEDNMNKWFSANMIPRDYPVIRSAQVCKRGPVGDPTRVRKRKKREMVLEENQAVGNEIERGEIRVKLDGEQEALVRVATETIPVLNE